MSNVDFPPGTRITFSHAGDLVWEAVVLDGRPPDLTLPTLVTVTKSVLWAKVTKNFQPDTDWIHVAPVGRVAPCLPYGLSVVSPLVQLAEVVDDEPLAV